MAILARVEADAAAYELTPQEARWAEIESRARLVLAAADARRRSRGTA